MHAGGISLNRSGTLDPPGKVRRPEMTVCPFCKTPLADPRGPCKSCGKHPTAQPAGSGLDDWGDDGMDLGGGLDLSRGGAMPAPTGPSAYAGGGLSLGDDDDPFADDVPAASLELDIPSHPGSRSIPAGTPSKQPPQLSGPPPHLSGLSNQPPQLSGPPPQLSNQPPQLLGPPPHLSSQPSQLSNQQPPPSQPIPSQPMPPSPPAGDPGAPASSQGWNRPVAPADPAALIARFPTPPTKMWEAPLYAMRVLYRQLELRQDLESLRRKRSPDVALYERALKTHDSKTFTVGLAITCAGLAIASFIFFLPVILRFMRAD